MKIIFMGTPDFAVPTLKKLYSSGHEVCCVFTQPDKPKGRGYKLTPPPVKTIALEHGTKVLQPQSLKKDSEEYINEIKKINPDVIVVVAYGKILPREVLDIPKFGCVNVHGSLLPKYRGAGPIQWAVLNDEKETGITTMLMADGIDTGDMLLKHSTLIGENETSAELFDRLSIIGGDVLVETLDRLEKSEIIPEKQDESKSTHAPMITKDMCVIDFSNPVRKIHKQICGLSDYPCATTTLNGKRLKVYRSEIYSNSPTGKKNGEVIDEKQLIVACGDGAIKFVEIQA
ncbi:MAG: methionyl-tRNA formyltransferase, partial [Clostridiales bacterium]|nr:methionyl-tRNA formyltransferase [Clostridiales bacterium]